MRRVQVEEGLFLRFPGQTADFADGLEVGLVVAEMARKTRTFERPVASRVVAQLHAVAVKMGYRTETGPEDDAGNVSMSFALRGVRPVLRVVSSRDAAEG